MITISEVTKQALRRELFTTATLPLYCIYFLQKIFIYYARVIPRLFIHFLFLVAELFFLDLASRIIIYICCLLCTRVELLVKYHNIVRFYLFPELFLIFVTVLFFCSPLAKKFYFCCSPFAKKYVIFIFCCSPLAKKNRLFLFFVVARWLKKICYFYFLVVARWLT